GGRETLPRIEHEGGGRYGWVTTQKYTAMVARGSGLPRRIATKLGAYIGYEQGGILGAFVGLFGSVAPSMVLMLILLGILLKYKNSPKVQRLTQYIRPIIAVLLGIMTYDFFFSAYEGSGVLHTIILSVASLILLERYKISPVFVVLGALIYGAIFLG